MHDELELGEGRPEGVVGLGGHGALGLGLGQGAGVDSGLWFFGWGGEGGVGEGGVRGGGGGAYFEGRTCHISESMYISIQTKHKTNKTNKPSPSSSLALVTQLGSSSSSSAMSAPGASDAPSLRRHRMTPAWREGGGRRKGFSLFWVVGCGWLVALGFGRRAGRDGWLLLIMRACTHTPTPTDTNIHYV